MNVFEIREHVDRTQIERLVHGFYEKVREDPELGPIFAGAIADDAWPAHLERMVAFWTTILLGRREYLGNPMMAHARSKRSATTTSITGSKSSQRPLRRSSLRRLRLPSTSERSAWEPACGRRSVRRLPEERSERLASTILGPWTRGSWYRSPSSRRR